MLSSGWLPGATGKHLLGLFSALPPPEHPSIMPVELLLVRLDHGSLAKPSCPSGMGGAQAQGAQGRHADHFLKKFLSCQAQLSPPGPSAEPGEKGDV